jgi:hypothetical protein
MKRFATLSLYMLAIAFTQDIKLTLERKSDDFIIHSYNYAIFVRKQDLADAIKKFNQQFHQHNSAVANDIVSGKLPDINAIDRSDSTILPALDLLMEDVLCRLLLEGRMAIVKDKTVITDVSIENRGQQSDDGDLVKYDFAFYAKSMHDFMASAKIREDFIPHK